MKLLCVGIFVLSCTVAFAQQRDQTQYPTEIYLGQPPSHGRLTVDDVIRLSQAGVGDDLILKQIQKKGQHLDLSTNDILRLKTAGVSGRVISAMLDPSSVGTSNTSGNSSPATNGVSAPVAASTPRTTSPPEPQPKAVNATLPATSSPSTPAPSTLPTAPVPPTSLAPQSAPVSAPPANDGKLRVYVSDRPISEVISMIQGGSYGDAHASGYTNGTQASYSASGYQASHVSGISNDQRGGADPRTLEVSGDLSAECHVSNLVVTSNPEAAEYILDFRRRGGTRSTWFVFGGLSGLAMSAAVKVDHAGLYKPNGDLVIAAKARTVGGAVKEICPYLAQRQR
jgi:hypothetical protein